MGQSASCVSVTGHLLLYLPHIYTHSCSLSHTLTHLYAPHTHTHTPTSQLDKPPKGIMHFPQLNRCSFPTIPSQPPRNMSFTEIKIQLFTLKSRTGRIWLPFIGNYDLFHDKLQGVKEPSKLRFTPLWTDSTDESLYWASPLPPRAHLQAPQLLSVTHIGRPTAPGATQLETVGLSLTWILEHRASSSSCNQHSPR